jgi:superfamily II DNA or RNA helicase
MQNTLYPHNREAYENVIKAFETSNRTCVIHPTGTGKSYIIAAVAQHFDKILVLGPNNFVLGQVKTVLDGVGKIIDYHTYQYLLKKTINDHYRLIVLDEFHRLGAEKWGERTRELLDRNPQAKILGCSATPVRTYPHKEDMAEKLFDSNIASKMDLYDAWKGSTPILPIPTYVVGVININSAIKKAKASIRKSRIFSVSEKRKRLNNLHNYELNWKKSSGVSSILERHIPKETKKIIVFCDHIFKVKNTMRNIKKWFKEAGIPVAPMACVHSRMKKSKIKQIMEDFKEKASNKGIKILIAINMLNEGIHIPGVNAVILLRITESSNVYFQQIGRCLTVDAQSPPIIIDMVANLKNINRETVEDGRGNKSKHKKYSSRIVPKGFTVYDYTLDIQKIIGENMYISTKERLAVLDSFYQKYGRLPSPTFENGMYKYVRAITARHKDDPEVKQFLIERGYDFGRPAGSKIEDISFITNFVEKNGRTPGWTPKEEKLAILWAYLKTTYPDNPLVQKYKQLEQDGRKNKKEKLLKTRLETIKQRWKDKVPKAQIYRSKEFVWLQKNYYDNPDFVKFKNEFFIRPRLEINKLGRAV